MLSAEYVVGLVDGEGSFSVHVAAEHSVAKRRAKVEPRFFVKLIERDKRLLEELQAFFNSGTLYFQRDDRPNHQHCYRYEVYNREELAMTIVPFFETHPLRTISKQRDFLFFREILARVRRKEHFTETGLAGIRVLQTQMH